MKARELCKILMKHPGWDVAFGSLYDVGMYCEVEEKHVEVPEDRPEWESTPKTWLILSPYECD
jgi:hypothetical protein